MTSSLIEQVQQFSEFASQHAAESTTLEALLERWRQETDDESFVETVRGSHADALAGKGQPVAEVFERIRAEIGLLK